ncbi:MAG TPA: S9 family peptidase [Myxococcaceae bacterium]|nr:S9 family peptidase [Myxococcaceae bacterium]
MVTSILLAALVSATPHPYNAHDQVTLARIGAPTVSPDGKQVVYTLRTTDLEADRGRFHLWSVPVAGGTPKQLTRGKESTHQPVWAPDGSAIYFLTNRSGSSQVWRLPAAGGEAEQVTRLELDVSAFALSPDGKQLAVALEVFPSCPNIACTVQRLEARKKEQHTGQIYDQLFVRHWDTWKDGRRSHVFVLPVAGGPARDLMVGMDADSPTKPFGGAGDFTFTPDGGSIIFTARVEGRAEAWSTNLDLWQVRVTGGKPVRLTEARKGSDSNPVFSPDGKTLAYLSMPRAGFEADRHSIVLRDMASGQERTLADGWDRSADSLAFSPDGKTIYATAYNLGQHSLFALDVQSGEVRTLVEQGTVGGVAVAEGGALVYVHDTLKAPGDLWRIAPTAGAKPTQLTAVNAEALASIRFGDYEQFSFKGAGGATVYGYVVKPVGFRQGRRYPLAFLIHGGPQGSFGNHFHYRWNPQTYAGQGFVAVMIDFHGSVGYGQAFTDAITGDWGGKPLEDLQLGLKAALERYPFIDGNRACALGASYGGYMINWIAGNWPDGFNCLVNHDGILNERMAWFDTEELWFPEWEHGGTPWESDGYTKHNPIDHVGKWKTPMLVIHGGRDYRVVDTQGLGTFTALQRKGIPSRLLYFPDENHWVLKPSNSVLWHETVNDWIKRWTR